MIKCPKCGYEHNSEDALYCGLCYELLKKIAKTPQPEQAEAVPQKTEASPFLTIALIAGILSGAGVYFYEASSTAGVKAQAALEVVRQQEKEQAAMAAFRQRAEAAGVACEIKTVTGGHIAKEIIKEAAQGYDLLVMATPFRRGLEVMRDAPSAILKAAPCDVLFVRHGE